MNRTAELTPDPPQPVEQTGPPHGLSPPDRSAPRLATAGRWLGKGFWAVMDQGLFAGANFILNVLLARWVSIEEYGAFAVAFALFLLLGAVHTALITEPMLVFGPKRYLHRLRPYVGTLLRLHLAVCASGAVVLGIIGVAAYVFDATHLAKACVAFALAQPFILFLWLMRRACYVRSRPRPAAIAGFSYLLLMIVGLIVLNRIGLSVELAIGMMALGATFAGGTLWLTQVRGGNEDRHHGIAATVYKRHIGYARWSIPAALCGYLGGSIYFFIIPHICGLAETGALRAAMNLAMPALHLLTALSPLVIVQLSNLRSDVAFVTMLRRILLLFVFASLFYWWIIFSWGPAAMRWVYDGKYGHYESLLPLVGSLPVLASISAVLRAALLTRGLWREAFYGSLATLCFALSAGIGMVFLFEIHGALICMAAGMAIQAVSATLFLFLRRTPSLS